MMELANNMNGSNIGCAIRGRQKTAYGFAWMYTHDYYAHGEVNTCQGKDM